VTEHEYNNILAIDTATRRLNLALLFAGDRAVQSGEVVARTHGQILMKKIDELFQSAGLPIEQLEALVVSLGPGSFTGLRIGLAAAKGIAVARGLPIVGVTMFEVAADRIGQQDDAAHIAIPSRKDEFYVGVCRNGAVLDDDVRIMSETELAVAVGHNRVFTIGYDPEDFGAETLKQIARGLEYDAGDLLRVGRNKLLRGERSDTISLEPAYMQKAIAEVRFDLRHGGN
jgi:tRNA threonylcarbamoyl adenosine modification protein YeaZ